MAQAIWLRAWITLLLDGQQWTTGLSKNASRFNPLGEASSFAGALQPDFMVILSFQLHQSHLHRNKEEHPVASVYSASVRASPYPWRLCQRMRWPQSQSQPRLESAYRHQKHGRGSPMFTEVDSSHCCFLSRLNCFAGNTQSSL